MSYQPLEERVVTLRDFLVQCLLVGMGVSQVRAANVVERWAEESGVVDLDEECTFAQWSQSSETMQHLGYLTLAAREES